MKAKWVYETLKGLGYADAANLLEAELKKAKATAKAMRKRRPTTSPKITPDIRAKVIQMHVAMGLANHRIAAALDINPGRVSEILEKAGV